MKVGLIDDEIIVMEPGDRYKALAQYMRWTCRYIYPAKGIISPQRAPTAKTGHD